MKKYAALLLVLMLVFAVVACSPTAAEPAAPETPAAEEADVPASDTPADEKPAEEKPAGEKPYLAIVSKGFQHAFWQTVYSGCQKAAEDYAIEITFEGPQSESDINDQISMLNAAISKAPDAIAFAALDLNASAEALTTCKEKGIPVIGFDTDYSTAPEGAVYATASTDTYAAGGVAAEEMFKNETIAAKISAATADSPVTIGVVSQDAISPAIVGRTTGFVEKMTSLCESVHAGAVEVTGHDVWNKAASSAPAVIIHLSIATSTSATDCQTAAQMALNLENVIGVFGSNEAAANGVLAATSDGVDLEKTNGKYKDLVAIGFDAGVNQKNAVKNQYFYGSVTQDPFNIGYQLVELAFKAINGEAVSNVDTGCAFYDYTNMDNEEIAKLLYD